jgi:hypothetical protein
VREFRRSGEPACACRGHSARSNQLTSRELAHTPSFSAVIIAR